MRRMLCAVAMVGAMAALCGPVSNPARGADDAKAQAASKAALQNLSEFIGTWTGSGESKEAKGGFWKEKMEWGWKFKGEDSWINVSFTDSKLFSKGEMKYDPAKKVYRFAVTTKDDKVMAFEGTIVRKVLELSYADPETKDVSKMTLSTNNEGARMVYDYAVQSKGKGLAKKLWAVQNGKDGASIASGKKNECVVTGGLGTMAVSFGGKTYYVCCSGCRDAFNEEPKKFVDAFEKKKK